MLNVWENLSKRESCPDFRSGHTSFIISKNNKESLVIFGGLGSSEAYSDMHKFDL